MFSCSVEDLLNSSMPKFTSSSDGGSVWTRLADIPTQPKNPGLATLRGHVLVVGGITEGNPLGVIHCYDAATNSWNVTGKMPTPVVEPVTVVFPSNALVVVGDNTTHVGVSS